MLKIMKKKHDICETKTSENGCKDMNLYQAKYLMTADKSNQLII